MIKIIPPYELFDTLEKIPDHFMIGDHLNGFDSNLDNQLLKKLDTYAKLHDKNYHLHVDQFFDSRIKQKYSSLNFCLDPKTFHSVHWNVIRQYKNCPDLHFKNFLCSFNGTPHLSRKLLVSILKKFNLWNPEYCSKNFCFSVDELDQNLVHLTGEKENFYRKFFISNDSQVFFDTLYSFNYSRFYHLTNIRTLEKRLVNSFLNVVSESVATSYYPFVTEKHLYSIVTNGLFITYGQPGWHMHLKNYYGFKLYTNLFDYGFDCIENPVERLVELITMISKFSNLSRAEWHDLYQIEKENIEYNYDHYMSNRCYDFFRSHA